MKIVISTVQRPNKSPYLKRCIDSIRQDWNGPVHLVVGGKETRYAEEIPNANISYIGNVEKGDGVQKAGFGYATCLKLYPEEDCLIVEDDAVFVKDWYKQLQERVSFIQERRFVLSLITPWEGAVGKPNPGIPTVQTFVYAARLSYENIGDYPVANIITYSNTTAIYYPASILNTRLPDFIKRFVCEDEGVYDLVVGYWLMRMNVPIYIAVPNLLKGVETADSGMGSTIKRFHVNYEDWEYSKW